MVVKFTRLHEDRLKEEAQLDVLISILSSKSQLKFSDVVVNIRRVIKEMYLSCWLTHSISFY
uniref:Uncharacterized protein n=1 Tax=Rhizophora mucronata TaxID=61149 RepID=A0A2P2QA90_RHIMU